MCLHSPQEPPPPASWLPNTGTEHRLIRSDNYNSIILLADCNSISPPPPSPLPAASSLIIYTIITGIQYLPLRDSNCFIPALKGHRSPFNSWEFASNVTPWRMRKIKHADRI